MTDTGNNIKIREHYSAIGFTERIKAALTTIAPESQLLAVAQLAPLDQFHTRGILATAELAGAAGLDAFTRFAGFRLRHRQAGALSGGHLRV